MSEDRRYITYDEYMKDSEKLHQEYYVQWYDAVACLVIGDHTKEEWKALLDADKHLNNIPIQYWDNISTIYKGLFAERNFKINGTRTWSLSMGVCALKATVRKYVEEELDE